MFTARTPCGHRQEGSDREGAGLRQPRASCLFWNCLCTFFQRLFLGLCAAKRLVRCKGKAFAFTSIATELREVVWR